MNRQVLNVHKSVLFKTIFSYLYTFLSEFYCKISFVKYNYAILISKNISWFFLAFICCKWVSCHTRQRTKMEATVSGTVYGYIRVSSKDQHTDRQRSALLVYGIPPHFLFTDRQSGKDFNRPQYKKLLRIL